MKKYIILLGLTAMVIASCTVNESGMALRENGIRLTLTGSSYTDTKVSIGEEDGGVFPLLWFTGDVISINSASDTTWVGEQAELYSESSGRKSGVFQTINALEPTSNMDLVILYPGTSLTYDCETGVITGSVPTLQTQRSANSSVHVGNNAFSYDETTIEAGQTEGVTFSLQQKTAFVKMVLSTSEYSSYNLTGAKLYGEGATLSGDVTYNIKTEELEVTNGETSVGATISNPSTFSGTQEVYFTALPCDLSTSTVYAIISMKNPNSTETVTIPIEISGGELKESCLSVIEVSDISASSCSVEWYDPVETRDLLDAWAYGPQNTYFVPQYSDKSNELVLDVKARGDFSKVKEPKYYGFITSSSEMSTRTLCQLPGSVKSDEGLTPSNSVNSDYTINVEVLKQSGNTGRWAVVGIYDESYNVIWSFMIWRYLEGDAPKDVTYSSDIVLLDRHIGADYSNSYAAEQASFGAAAYFQWGRKDPFPWSNSGLQYTEVTTPVGSDVSVSIQYPYISYAYGGDAEDHGDWQEKEHRADLWGMDNNTTNWYDPDGVGHKTIYDPCPEGYRVCDPKVFNEVKNKAERWETPNGHSLQTEDVINPDSPFYKEESQKGYSVLAYKLSDGTYDYWPYMGCRWCGSGANYGNRPTTNMCHAALYWSNGVHPASSYPYRGVCIEYCYLSTSYDTTTTDANRARAFTIRCQKDDENR